MNASGPRGDKDPEKHFPLRRCSSLSLARGRIVNAPRRQCGEQKSKLDRAFTDTLFAAAHHAWLSDLTAGARSGQGKGCRSLQGPRRGCGAQCRHRHDPSRRKLDIDPERHRLQPGHDRLAARPDDPTSSDDLTARLRHGHADPRGRLRGVWKVPPGRTLGAPPGH
jgi:hypothetical protein